MSVSWPKYEINCIVISASRSKKLRKSAGLRSHQKPQDQRIQYEHRSGVDLCDLDGLET